MDLIEFAHKVGAAVIQIPEVAAMEHPGTSLSDSQFLSVTTEDGREFSVHIQEKTS